MSVSAHATGDQADSEMADTHQRPAQHSEQVRPLIIFEVPDDLKRDSAKQLALYRRLGVEERIKSVSLDRYKNLIVFANTVEDAEYLMKRKDFFEGLKKKNLNDNESKPAAIIKDITSGTIGEHYESVLEPLGVVEYIWLEPKSSKHYSDAPKPTFTSFKLFFSSIEARDNMVKNGLSIRPIHYRVEPSIRIVQCLKCKSFGHTVSKCQNEKRCARCAATDINHDEAACSAVFRCANCDQAHPVFDRSCKTYLHQKRAQLSNSHIKHQATTTSSPTSSPTSTSTTVTSERKYSEIVQQVQANNTATGNVVQQLIDMEANRKKESDSLKQDMIAAISNGFQQVTRECNNYTSQMVAQSGLALHETLARLFPDKAKDIALVCNETYSKYNLGSLNIQPMQQLLDPTQLTFSQQQHLQPQFTLAAFPNQQQQIQPEVNQQAHQLMASTAQAYQQTQPHMQQQQQQQIANINIPNLFSHNLSSYSNGILTQNTSNRSFNTNNSQLTSVQSPQ